MVVIQFGDQGESHRRDNDQSNSDANGHDNSNGDNAPDVSMPTRRQRWATQRQTPAGSNRKRVSIMDRFHKRASRRANRKSTGSSDAAGSPEPEPDDNANNRRIYFNTPVPEDEKDEEGHLKADYVRNKIRTAKYTPLSFIPQNLFLQFHNVANIYFLIVVVLAFFPLFGSTNPGLGAVPIIAILTITAIKDAIEDWRRTVLDNELNNSPIHRLVDWNNVNSVEDDISLWRRFKKAFTKKIKLLWKTIKALQKGEKKPVPEEDLESTRGSLETTRPANRDSSYFHRDPNATQTTQTSRRHDSDNIEMTPVPSPNPDSHPPDKELNPAQPHRAPSSTATYLSPDVDMLEANATITPQHYGSVLDKTRKTPEVARFKRDYWKNVQVGDFIRIYNEDQIPADIVVLSTSDPDGACYVETKNLDGETNLKVRHALHAGRDIKHARDCEKTEFTIESEAPHANLYQYNGSLKWNQQDPKNPEGPPKQAVEPITINNLLLRGCSLRNTEWVLGVVVFTGVQTKIMLNSGATPTKRARLAKDLNWYVIYNFVILFIMCLSSGIVMGVRWSQGSNSLDYFEFGSYGDSPPLDGFITFFAAVILYQNLVPIPLYISLEIVRSFQAIFIHSDNFMFYDKLSYPCTPKSWNISDDLGQIEYIFSDKTGTLTQNVMEFKKCTINGVAYGEAYTEAQAGMQRRQGVNVEEEGHKAREEIARSRSSMLKQLRSIHDNPYLHDDELTFVSAGYVSDLAGANGDKQKRANEDFMLALGLCHTVVSERTPGDPPTVEFKAQSPDEAALVATARDCGFTVLGRTGDDIRLNVMGEERAYTVLNTLEFNSSRKRMSSIIRMPDGKIILYCKGADSIIYSRLAPGQQPELRKATAEHLEMFAQEGLRTLCVAQRELGEEQYQEWNKRHEDAAAALVDRDGKLEEVASEIEQNLTLIGGTAIEDRLQDGVPDTIALLATAGIKLWVLTGDKVETAINIGFSCNLLTNDMDLIVFDVEGDDMDSASKELEKQLAVFGLTGSEEELVAARENHDPPDPTHAIIVDGDVLKLMLSDELQRKFLLLCKQCRSVLCCRVSPAQKAAVVRMVKSGLNIMALSIGDGANDVAMIQEADVGVGIVGEEGRQAAMSSDYAIGQFRFLQRLILVHGRWSYRRLGETLSNFFYKNIVWTMALFWYSIYNDFDCSYLVDYTYLVLVNLAFTSLPVIFMGILDQDVDDKVSLAVPQLYMRGIVRAEWTPTKFWLYMLDGLYQSVMSFFVTYLTYRPAQSVTANGMDLADRTRMGVFVACAAIIACNVYILINTYRWDWLTVLINAISCLLPWFWTGVYSSSQDAGQFYGAGREVFGTLTFWLVTLLTVTICLTPRFALKAMQKIYRPIDVDIVREQISQGKFKYLENFEAYVPLTAGVSSTTSSDLTKTMDVSAKNQTESADDEQPMYPPSVAPTTRTGNTHNPRSQNGSDGTGYSASLDWAQRQPQPVDRTGASTDRNRMSIDRNRVSMDRPVRASFEASREFSSAAMLTRMEGVHGTASNPR